AKLGLDQDKPEAYLLQGNGMLNAFATRFLGRHYVVLLSDVVDAMQAHPEGVNFYIGHELGHVRMKHLTGKLWRAPVLWIPLLGAAYSRANESTCDRHGRACCESPEAAARAMVALAAVGIPAYKDYQARSRLTFSYTSSEPARRALAAYYVEKKKVPDSLEAAGVPATLADGSQLSLDSDTMTLTVDSPHGQLVFTP